MKEILLRLRLPLNTFWKNVRAFLVVVSAISIALTEAVTPFLGNSYLPEWAMNILEHVYMFGAFGIMITQLTVKDTNELQKAKHHDNLPAA